MIYQQFNIRAVLGLLTAWNFKPGSKDAPLANVRWPLLRPVDMAVDRINGNADAMTRNVLRIGKKHTVAHENGHVRTVQVWGQADSLAPDLRRIWEGAISRTIKHPDPAARSSLHPLENYFAAKPLSVGNRIPANGRLQGIAGNTAIPIFSNLLADLVYA